MSTSMIPPLRSDIRQIRPRRLNVRWMPPEVRKLRSWVSGLGHEKSKTLLTILGPNPVYRAEAYRQLEGSDIFNVIVDKSSFTYDWTEVPLLVNLTQRISIPNILGILVARKELQLGPELTNFIDRGYFRVSKAFQALWEVRFLHEEGSFDEAESLMQALCEWSVGHHLNEAQSQALAAVGVYEAVSSSKDRYDMILLWLTLARYNGVLDRLILPYDGFERIQGNDAKIEELRDLLQAAERWAPLGSPLGVVVGVVDLNLPQPLKELLIDSTV